MFLGPTATRFLWARDAARLITIMVNLGGCIFTIIGAVVKPATDAPTRAGFAFIIMFNMLAIMFVLLGHTDHVPKYRALSTVLFELVFSWILSILGCAALALYASSSEAVTTLIVFPCAQFTMMLLYSLTLSLLILIHKHRFPSRPIWKMPVYAVDWLEPYGDAYPIEIIRTRYLNAEQQRQLEDLEALRDKYLQEEHKKNVLDYRTAHFPDPSYSPMEDTFRTRRLPTAPEYRDDGRIASWWYTFVPGDRSNGNVPPVPPLPTMPKPALDKQNVGGAYPPSRPRGFTLVKNKPTPQLPPPSPSSGRYLPVPAGSSSKKPSNTRSSPLSRQAAFNDSSLTKSSVKSGTSSYHLSEISSDSEGLTYTDALRKNMHKMETAKKGKSKATTTSDTQSTSTSLRVRPTSQSTVAQIYSYRWPTRELEPEIPVASYVAQDFAYTLPRRH